MLRKNRNVFAMLAATGLLLASCATARQVAVQPTVVNQPATMAPSATAQPAASPTAPPTATSAPPTPTVAPTPASAPAASPYSEGATLVKTLLTTNGECELPCWWGIQPGGELTPASLETIAGALSHSMADDLFTISVNNSDKDVVADLDYQMTVAAALSDTRVSEIQVHGGTPGAAPPPGTPFGTDWRAYAPPRLLTKLGAPAEVRLSSSTFGGSEVIFFTLNILYPDKGIAIRYDGFAPKRGARFMICPVMTGVAGIDGITSVDLLLTPPGDADRFNDSLSRWKSYKPDSTTPIQDAIGKSVAEFYDMFKQDGPDACFEPVKS